MHHDIQKIISYHNFYLFFPICKWKEFELFQLLESFKKNVLMHHPSIKKSMAYCMQFPIWDIVWMAPTSCWNQCRKQHWKSGLGFQGLWVRNIEHQDNSEIKELYALVWARILRTRQDQRKLLELHILNCFKLAEQKGSWKWQKC